MNKLGSIGSSVMVGRMVGVKVGKGVSVTSGVPVGGVVVGCGVLITNKSGVFEAGNPNGVAVGPNVFTGVGVCRNGSDGNPLHPERSEIIRRIKAVFFMKHLLCHLCLDFQHSCFEPSTCSLAAGQFQRRAWLHRFNECRCGKITAPIEAASPVQGRW